MLYAFFAFVLFLVVMQVAVYMLPVLLILIFGGCLFSLFARPKIKVYTHTFTFPSSADPSPFGSDSYSDPNKPVRKLPEDIIDAEFTEHQDSAAL